MVFIEYVTTICSIGALIGIFLVILFSLCILINTLTKGKFEKIITNLFIEK